MFCVGWRDIPSLLCHAGRGPHRAAPALLPQGADAWRADREERCTALHYAAMNGHTEAVRTLLTCCIHQQQQQQQQGVHQPRPSITLSSRSPPSTTQPNLFANVSSTSSVPPVAEGGGGGEPPPPHARASSQQRDASGVYATPVAR